MKRLFDMLLATIIIITFMPIGIIIVIILLFTGEGEVFYKQSRIGLHGEIFSLIKFVTMVKNSPNLGAGDITLKDDPRVLPFGKLLRKTKLNEFPQFINVLVGDMSLVGPRPLVKNQYDMIPENLKQKIKHEPIHKYSPRKYILKVNILTYFFLLLYATSYLIIHL